MMTGLRCGFIILCVLMSYGAMAQTASVSISPAAKRVRIDSSFTMSIRIDNVQKLHGYSVTVAYDTFLIRFVAARKSSFLSNTLFFANVDSIGGRITLDEAILGSTSKDGSGILAELDFTPRRVGSGVFSTAKADLRDPSNQVIPSSMAGGSITITPVTAVDTRGMTPEEFALRQNYPNPFNPGTTVSFAIPTTGHVTIEVYAISGQKVAVLLDEVRSAGKHVVRWNGRSQDGSAMPSGTYLCIMRSGDRTASMQMVLLK